MLICLLTGFLPADSGAIELYLEHKITGRGGKITALAFSPDGVLAAYGSRNGEVSIIDLASGEPEKIFAGARKEITAIAFSPDSRYAVVAQKGKGVLLLDLGDDPMQSRPANGAGDLQLKEAKGRIDVLEFSGDGKYLAAGGDRDKIYIWEIPSGQMRSKLEGHEKDILAIAFDQRERRVISVGKDRKMIIWDAPSMKPLRRYNLEAGTMPGSGVDVTAARISADRLFVAVALDEHIMRKGGRGMIFEYHLAFFDVSKGVLLKTLEDNNRKIDHLALFPGNCFVAFDNSTLQSKAIALGNIEAGSIDLSYSMRAECKHLEFSPDGRWLAGVADAEGGSESDLHFWTVDYEIPASGCFMSRLRITSTGGPVIGPNSTLNPASPLIAAVLPFAAGQEAEDLGLGRSAAHFLENKLTGNPHLRLIERSRIDDIIGELKFQQSGLVDNDTAVEMGKLLGARLIITGSFDRTGADLVITARIVDVETGEILGTKQVHCGQCGSDDIFDAIDLLSEALVAD